MTWEFKKNNGSQPVADDVIVDVVCNNGCKLTGTAGRLQWGLDFIYSGISKWRLHNYKSAGNTLINHGDIDDVINNYGGVLFAHTASSQVDVENNDVPNIGKADDITETLQERGNRYGAYPEHARITQNMKRAMADSPNWESISDDKKEALEMIAHKIGRILNGDPEYKDSWHDIIGYSKLIDDTLKGGE